MVGGRLSLRNLQFSVPDMAPDSLVELDLPLEASLELGLLLGSSLGIWTKLEYSVRDAGVRNLTL